MSNADDTDPPDAVPRPGAPGPMDVHIGQRIRLRRTLMGLSQEKLGEALGLTFQQVQKYERGANRVSATRLFEMARLMNVPVGFFYDGLPEGLPGDTAAEGGAIFSSTMGFAEPAGRFGGPPPKRAETPMEDAALFTRKETIELVRAFHRIPDEAVRRRVLDLVCSMAPPEAG